MPWRRAKSKILHMRRLSCHVLLLTAAFGPMAVAQTQPFVDQPQNPVLLVKLSPLRYPALARQARITGDVRVNVHVRPDGGVASAEALSGHPLLKSGAVENARQSQYQCNGCPGETDYVLTYTFGLIEDLKPYDKFEDRPARAGKCLYLWKCGLVRINTFDSCTAVVPPVITQSPGHVKILASPPMCVETSDSTTASR